MAYAMGASEVLPAPPAAPPQPRPAQIPRQGQTQKRASAAPSHRSNAPIRKESQSILSKIVAHSASYLIPSPESMPDTSRYSGPSANIPSHSHSTSIFLSI